MRRAPRRPAPVDATEDARQRLREFAEFIAAQNPDVLAARVTQLHDTLLHVGRIQSFFRKYRAGLKARLT